MQRRLSTLALRTSWLVCIVSILICITAYSAPIKLERSDSFELLRSALQDTVFTFGHVRFSQDSALLNCDSAIWVKDVSLSMWGNVDYSDGIRRMIADTIFYDLRDSTMYATGDSVILISFADSIRAVGNEVFYNRSTQRLELLNDARIQFRYPDTSNIQTIDAVYIRYESGDRTAVAHGSVILKDSVTTAYANCAKFDHDPGRMRLYDSVTVLWGTHVLTGEFVTFYTINGKPRLVEVYGGGEAIFRDEATAMPDTLIVNTIADTGFTSMDSMLSTDSLAPTEPLAVSSRLKGRQLSFAFKDSKLSSVIARGEAYSFYHPKSDDSLVHVSNTASGDSIKVTIKNDSLKSVHIFGDVEGYYVETREPDLLRGDTSRTPSTDSVNYRGERITYDFQDSVFTLVGLAEVQQDLMDLRADSIQYSTTNRFVKAFSRDTTAERKLAGKLRRTEDQTEFTEEESTVVDTLTLDTRDRINRTTGGVVLKDGDQTVVGSYVEYSMVTNKGLLLQSNTQYESAYYNGGELYRSTPEVYYIEDGSYTTCNFATPHFHFWSKNMKVVNDDKAVARPVVFYIEKIPLLIIPYYVFPLNDGRRSGILNFKFGNFNQGGRFVSNVGYYWAASDYWDYEGWLDYYEVGGLSISSRVRYAKRYVFTGSVAGSYSWDSRFSSTTLEEIKNRRWNINFNHSHTFDPSFTANASGNFVSDASYYSDFSNDLDKRLNRTLRSQANFSKRFGSVSTSGSVIYDKNLDTQTKTITYPNFRLTLPTWRPFGSPGTGEDSHWYQSISLGYSSFLRHFETESVKQVLVSSDTTVTPPYTDTTITIVNIDTMGMVIDTTFDTMLTMHDSTVSINNAFDSTDTKRKYSTYTHSTSIGPNFTLFKYFPSRIALSYAETYFYVNQTDQSDAAGVRSGRLFRTFSTSLSASVSTNLYGVVRPNVFGLKGLRHHLAPSVSYQLTPGLVFDDETQTAATFVGTPRGQTNARTLSFGLGNTFEAKVGDEESERVITLLTANSSIGYNPNAIGNKWSNLSTNFQTNIAGLVNLSGSIVHDVNDDFKKLNFNINSSVSFRGSFGDFHIPEAVIEKQKRESVDGSGAGSTPSAQKRSWSLNLGHFYSEDQIFKSHFLRMSLVYQITPTMSMSFSQHYDFVNKSTINRNLEVRRRLHCWEGIFSWTPTGSNQGFYFRLNVVDLPDIKYEKSLSNVRGRLF